MNGDASRGEDARAAAASEDPITQLLLRWQHGDAAAADALAARVYDELHAIAARRLSPGGPADLQATELLSEAWIRLSARAHPFASRSHFYAIAALQMRQLLVDLARRQGSQKRRGVAMTLTVRLRDPAAQPEDLLQVAEALDRLVDVDARKAQMLVLNAFAGLSAEECARLLDVSVATVQRDLRFARAWLAARLT